MDGKFEALKAFIKARIDDNPNLVKIALSLGLIEEANNEKMYLVAYKEIWNEIKILEERYEKEGK